MQESYARALTLVLKHEGGYSDHPADPGGATMKGVTQRVYDGYRRRKGLLARSVKKLERGEMEDIYRSLYWSKIDGDELPAGLDYCVFDAAVNSGTAQAVKWLQRALNKTDQAAFRDHPIVLAVDGVIGPATLHAADSHDEKAVADIMCNLRLAMLKTLRTWSTFGAGWSTRIAGVRKAALSWK